MPEFAGFAYTDAGVAVAAVAVSLYDRNTTSPARATTTTDANGYYTISHATEGRFDIELVNGTNKRRVKYDEIRQYEELETSVLKVRNPANTFAYNLVPAAIAAARTLNLPLITGTDTLAALGMAQTFTAIQKIGGTAVRSATEGTLHLDIFDGVAPVGTLANGISLYSTAGELRVMDSSGTATLLSPHDVEGYWVFDSVDTVTGKRLKVDMEKMVRFLNQHFGENWIHEEVVTELGRSNA